MVIKVTSFGHEFSKNLKMSQKTKNSSKFVWILANHFNLTNFVDQKMSKILISRDFEIFH